MMALLCRSSTEGATPRAMYPYMSAARPPVRTSMEVFTPACRSILNLLRRDWKSRSRCSMTVQFLATPDARPAPSDFTLRVYRTMGLGRFAMRPIWCRARSVFLLQLPVFLLTGLTLRGLTAALWFRRGFAKRSARLHADLFLLPLLPPWTPPAPTPRGPPVNGHTGGGAKPLGVVFLEESWGWGWGCGRGCGWGCPEWCS